MQSVVADASIRVRRDIRAMAEGRLRRKVRCPRLFRIDIAVWVGADVRWTGFFLYESSALARMIDLGARVNPTSGPVRTVCIRAAFLGVCACGRVQAECSPTIAVGVGIGATGGRRQWKCIVRTIRKAGDRAVSSLRLAIVAHDDEAIDALGPGACCGFHEVGALQRETGQEFISQILSVSRQRILFCKPLDVVPSQLASIDCEASHPPAGCPCSRLRHRPR